MRDYEENKTSVNELNALISRAIFSAMVIIVAIVVIFATPKMADIGIVIGASLLIGIQFAPLFTKNKILKSILSVLGIIVVIGSAIISLSFASVEVGHTGFLVTFGRVSEQTYGEGIHLKPFYSQMVQIDNRIQLNGHDDKPMLLETYTKDGQKLFLEYSVNYRVDRANAGKLYKEVGLNYFNTVLRPIIQESVKNEIPKYSADDYLIKRAEYAKAVEDDIREKFKSRYIDLISTAIENDHFADTYENAIEEKQVALQNKLKAEQVAEQKKIEAAAEAEAKRLKVDADAYEIQKIQDQLNKSPNYIEYIKANKWNGILPKAIGQNINPFIDFKE